MAGLFVTFFLSHPALTAKDQACHVGMSLHENGRSGKPEPWHDHGPCMTWPQPRNRKRRRCAFQLIVSFPFAWYNLVKRQEESVNSPSFQLSDLTWVLTAVRHPNPITLGIAILTADYQS